MVINPSLSDLRSEERTKPVPPQPHRLVADVDAALMQQVLDVAQRERKSDVHHHGEADNFW